MRQPEGGTTTVRVVEPVAVAALADLLGAEDVDLATGAPLPLLWHWVALARWPAATSLGPDGHPRRADLVVDGTLLTRRMFGGGVVRGHAPLPIGAEVSVSTHSTPPRTRTGRHGDPMALVDETTTVRDRGGTVLLEEVRHLVYLGPRPVEPPEAPGRPGDVDPAPLPLAPRLLEPGSPAWTLRTDPTLLARFSALTANPHRIHLDWPYATRVEAYPGLVVHGPLLALVMAEVDRRGGTAPRRALRHRGLAPLTCGTAAEVLTGPSADHLVVRAGTTVHARLEPDPAD